MELSGQACQGIGVDTTVTTYARNNLFHSMTISGNAWEWRDNHFDTASRWQYYGGVANGNNAYRNCPRQLTPAGSGNVTLTADRAKAVKGGCLSTGSP